MNKFAKRMLNDRLQDGRNPYGSRGGYVDSRSYDMRSRDYYDRNYDMANRSYDRAANMNYDRNYDRRMDRNYSDGWYDDIRRFPDMYKLEYPDRDYEEGYQERLAKQRERDNASDYQDMATRRTGSFDYETSDGSEMKLTSKDIKKWEKMLENADGTHGAKFQPEQVKSVAQTMGIKFDKYSPEALTMAANMLYSDYCKDLGNDMVVYVRMGRSFLEDKDFDGDPEEKLMLYYKCISEKD